MSWYYLQGEKQAGPASDEEFEQKIKDGVIGPSTYVWSDGMADWKILSHIRPELAAGSGGEVICSQCGKAVSRQDAITLNGLPVCFACKPAVVQRLKEGAVLPGRDTYAGFWIRFVAKLVDGFVVLGLCLPFLAVYFFYIFTSGTKVDPNGLMPLLTQLVLQVTIFGVNVVYSGFMLGKYSATLGKRAVGLTVIRADHSPMTYGRGFGRAFAEILSGLICDVGYILAAFDAEKKSLHDTICDTRVVFTR
jgi:uncharacterized RDD family membrane protein YckC